MTNNNNKIVKFNGSELISDVLLMMPEASQILLAHGLGCLDCQFNSFETLEEGFFSHGFDKYAFDMVLDDLNEAAEDLKIYI